MKRLLLSALILLCCISQSAAWMNVTTVGGGVPAAPAEPTTINLQVASNDDDGVNEGTNCNYWVASFGGNFGVAGIASGPVIYETGYRWAVAVPQGATINSATLSLYAYNRAGSGSVLIRISADDVDNAGAWGLDSCPVYEGWTSTTAYTDASISTWTSDTWYQYDVTDIVQEIVNRVGWSSGNYIRIGVYDNGSSAGEFIRIYDYASGAANSAKLDIEYVE